MINSFYPINIINKSKLFNNPNKSCIYIGRHSTHNWEILLCLLELNKYSIKPIWGLGHYLMYIVCPWYLLFNITIGTKKNAINLINNNEYLFIIPGGGEEMTFGNENVKHTYWFSKSRNYKTGFAKLAYDNNLAVIPIHGQNVEYMVFSPIIYIFNKLYITKLYHILMINVSNIYLYKLLFSIKMLCTLICSYLVIPIPTNINIIIGEHIYKEKDEDIISYTQRCEYELNGLL